MDNIYLLITGQKIKAFYSLSRLAKSIGIEPKGLKEKLPFKQGSFEIRAVDVDTTL